MRGDAATADHSIGQYRVRARAERIGVVKALCIFVLGLVAVPAALAQQNDAVFKQTQGDDGLTHFEVTASYGFPGLPPRTANSGAGTVRVTLPSASFKLESVDTGYTCVQTDPASIMCSAQDGGPAFPTSMTMRLVSPSCWAPEAGQAGSVDVWAAPTDPGSAPDVSLPLQPGECAARAGGDPPPGPKGARKGADPRGGTGARA